MYESHINKQAKILSHKDVVYEKDGDQDIINEMTDIAHKHFDGHQFDQREYMTAALNMTTDIFV